MFKIFNKKEEGYYYKEGNNALYNDEDYDKAIKMFSKAIRKNEYPAFSTWNRGLAYAKLYKYGKAINDYEKSVELEPYLVNKQNFSIFHDKSHAISEWCVFAEAFSKHGQRMAEKGKYDKVTKFNIEAIKLEPTNCEYYINAADACFSNNDYLMANRIIAKGIVLLPVKTYGIEHLYWIRGLLKLKIGENNNYENCVADYNMTFVINPEFSTCNNKYYKDYISEFEKKAERFKDTLYQNSDAVNLYHKVMEINPDKTKQYLSKIDEIRNLSVNYLLQDKKYDSYTIFCRAIKEPIRKNHYSNYNETNCETELRKIIRKPNKSTYTYEISGKDGSYNRSVTMTGKNIKLFARVGLGISEPLFNDILTISEYDHGSGKGKKHQIRKAQNSKIPQTESTGRQINTLKNNILNNEVIECNEINMNIKNNGQIKFIFFDSSKSVYSNEKNYSRELKLLLSVYLKNKVTQYMNQKLPLFEHETGKGFNKIEYPKNIKELLKIVIDKEPYILDFGNIDFWNSFEKYINADAELKKITGDFFFKLLNDNPNSKSAQYIEDIVKFLKHIKYPKDSKLLNKIIDSWLISNCGNVSKVKNKIKEYEDKIANLNISIKSDNKKNKQQRKHDKKNMIELVSTLKLIHDYGKRHSFNVIKIMNSKKNIKLVQNKNLGL